VQNNYGDANQLFAAKITNIITTLICFLVLLKVNNNNYKVTEDSSFYRISSQLNSVSKNFLLYNISTGANQYHIKTAGP
jgi:hypothetical protein